MLKQNLNRTSHFAHHTSNKGITLIALIITIIVMLILVAVTINMAVNGGLFEKAGQAVGQTQNAIDYEQELANGKIQINGVWYNSIDEYISGGGEDINWEAILADAKNNPDKYLQLAKEKGQNVEENTVIGIGTDGKVVNMDLWNYYDFGEYYSLGKRMGYNTFYTGYSNSNIINGKIQGTMPMYIKEDQDFYEVKCLQATFYECTSLEVAPEIPDGVTFMEYTFMGCTKLCGELIINSELTYYDRCLYNAGYDASSPLYLSGNSTMLQKLLETKGDSTNIFIK